MSARNESGRGEPAPWAITEASFLAAAKTNTELPPETGAELAFAGRSNVGKSSLMNLLLGRRKLVRTSSTPGCTRQVAFFEARARDGAAFVLVDLPGYGYASRSKSERAAWARLLEHYLVTRRTLRAVVVLIDARHGVTAHDEQLLEFLTERAQSRPRIILVATKVDKLPRSRQRAELDKLAEQTKRAGLEALGGGSSRSFIPASALTGQGAAEIWRALRSAVAGEPAAIT